MTAEDFKNLHLQYGTEQQPGELPAAIEHDFADGRMVDHYYVTPSAAFWADDAVQKVEEGGTEGDKITGISFMPHPDGGLWQIVVHQKAMLKEATFDFTTEEFQKMLAENNTILPGEPGFTPPPVKAPSDEGAGREAD